MIISSQTSSTLVDLYFPALSVRYLHRRRSLELVVLNSVLNFFCSGLFRYGQISVLRLFQMNSHSPCSIQLPIAGSLRLETL